MCLDVYILLNMVSYYIFIWIYSIYRSRFGSGLNCFKDEKRRFLGSFIFEDWRKEG